MEPKLFCLPRTRGTNNHIKQGDACFFVGNPIGITYNQLPAMLTILFHNFSLPKKICRTSPIRFDSLMYSFFKEFYEWRELFFLFVKIIHNFSSPFRGRSKHSTDAAKSRF